MARGSRSKGLAHGGEVGQDPEPKARGQVVSPPRLGTDRLCSSLMGSCHMPLRLVCRQVLPASATLHRPFLPAGTLYKQKLTTARLLGEKTPYLLPLPQTSPPSLVPSQHQRSPSDTAPSPAAGSPPRPSWAPRLSRTDGGKDGVPLPRRPARLVIFSPPAVDASGVSRSVVRTQP